MGSNMSSPHDYKCQDCDEKTTTNICEYCQKEICMDCEGPENNYILCRKCYYNLYVEQKITVTDMMLKHGSLIQCGSCGNIWDGNAQCNCYEYFDFQKIDTDDELTDEEDLS